MDWNKLKFRHFVNEQKWDQSQSSDKWYQETSGDVLAHALQHFIFLTFPVSSKALK